MKADWLGQPNWNTATMHAWSSSSFTSNYTSLQTVSGFAGTFNSTYGIHNNDSSGYGMWLTAAGGGGGIANPSPSGVAVPAWIAYDFGSIYEIANVSVWNYNQNAGGGLGLGRGLKNIVIDVSTDNFIWTRVYDGTLTKATGFNNMPCTDVIDLACVKARYIVINAYTHWNDDGSGDYYGLSEVRFNLPGNVAMNPHPANNAVNTLRYLQLNWRPGVSAARLNGHDVYFGTDFSSVRDATATNPLGVYKGRQDSNSYDSGLLAAGQICYWRVDEVNSTNIWKGDVWKFTVDSGICSHPYPDDKKIDLPRSVILKWQKGAFSNDVNGNDVFFGSNFNDVNNANIDSLQYYGRHDANSFNPGMLLPGKKYYWRIDAVNGLETWKGEVWSFKVRSVLWDDFSSIVSQWLLSDCNYPDWCRGADFDYSGKVDFVDFSVFANYWQARPIRIMPLGDSITRGLTMGVLVPGGYRTRLYNRLTTELFEIDFVGSANDNPDTENLPDPDHEGHGGYRIDQISDSIENWLNQNKPDIVLLHIGTNDIAQDYLLDMAPARLDSLISQITASSPAAYIIVALIITSTDAYEAAQINAYNSRIPDIVAAHAAMGKNVVMVDMYSYVPVSQFYDMYHPNEAGYDTMADIWFTAIDQLSLLH